MSLWTDVETFTVCRNCGTVAIFDVDVCVDRIGESCASCGVDGKINGLAERFCLFEHLVAVIDLFVVYERETDAAALCFDEGVSHTAADDERVALVEKIVDDVKFIGNFRTAENSNERTNGVLDCVAKEFEFFFDKETADCNGCKTVLNDTCGCCVCTVCSAECVVDVYVAEVCEFSAKVFAILFFARFETSVFKQNDFAVFECRDFCVCVVSHQIGCKRHFAGEMLCEFFRNRSEREFLLVVFKSFCDIFRFCSRLFFCGKRFNRFLFFLVETETFRENVVGLAHVRAKYHFCTVIDKILNGGKSAVDTVLVGDNSVNHRHVEVTTNQTLFAFDVYVADCHFCHRYSPLRK